MRSQKHDTKICRAKTHHLCFPASLHQRLSFRVLLNRLYIICRTASQTSESKEPEDDAERHCYPPFKRRGLAFEMEGDEDGYTDDSHVYS